jgi:4-alpha-glucanotransferase
VGKQHAVKPATDSQALRAALSSRSAGVLLHATSLPGRRLGREAFAFIDWLAEAGQGWWQLLPLGPPDRFGSPYKSRSAFAGWPGLLAEPRAPVSAAEKLALREREAYWIEDWIRLGPRDALADQVRFDREWARLREYATQRGVRLLGDLAIYVAPGSVDHRAHPRLFQTGLVAGAPPDAFSAAGQLWGNPLYDWPVLRRSGYRWWVERLRRTLELFDAVRLDHFRGFVAYWAVPEHDADATGGGWRRGPGLALFRAFARELGAGLPLVAEDLGVITPPVERLRDQLGTPGMVVLQFGFDADHPRSPHRFENHLPNRVVYTGTHDHDTARGWYESLAAEQRGFVDAELRRAGIRPAEAWWGLIELALRSPARTAIVQAQDILGLGSRARMNDPSRTGGNWRWVMEPGALTAEMAKRLRSLTESAGR